MSKRRISIHTAIKQRVPTGSRVLVGVSGGRDSMVLVHGLLHVARLLAIEIEACHVDHCLRPSSASDASFVEAWCRDRNIPCHVTRLEPKPVGENLEAWARQKRYETFRRVMQERNLDILCTAHTANDVAETLLIRLLANKELHSIEEWDPRRRCVRPLIEVTREQINEYVQEWSVPYVEDLSNQDPQFVRNRVRHELLPLLAERFDPSIVWILAERARSLAADVEALEDLARISADEIGPLEQQSSTWLARCRTHLQSIPTSVQWRVIQLLLRPLVGYTLGESKAKSIVATLFDDHGVLQLGQDTELKIVKGGVLVA